MWQFLDLKFIGTSKTGDEIIGKVKIKTKTLVFVCELNCNDKIIAPSIRSWKFKLDPSNLGPGG